MSWSDDIRCLYCDGRLPLYRKITHGQFCSSAHRKQYWQDQETLAVERLRQTHNSLQAYAPPAPPNPVDAIAALEPAPPPPDPVIAGLVPPPAWTQPGLAPGLVASDPLEYEIEVAPRHPASAAFPDFSGWLQVAGVVQLEGVHATRLPLSDSMIAFSTPCWNEPDWTEATVISPRGSAPSDRTPMQAGPTRIPLASALHFALLQSQAGLAAEPVAAQPGQVQYGSLRLPSVSGVLDRMMDQLPHAERLFPLRHFAATGLPAAAARIVATTALSAPANRPQCTALLFERNAPVFAGAGRLEFGPRGTLSQLQFELKNIAGEPLPGASASIEIPSRSTRQFGRTAPMFAAAGRFEFGPRGVLSQVPFESKSVVEENLPEAPASLQMPPRPVVQMDQRPPLAPCVVYSVSPRIATLKSAVEAPALAMSQFSRRAELPPLLLEMGDSLGGWMVPPAQKIPLAKIASAVPAASGPRKALILPQPLRTLPRLPVSKLEPASPRPVIDIPAPPPSASLPRFEAPAASIPVAFEASPPLKANPASGIMAMEPWWAHATGFWKHGPRDLKMLLLGVPVLIALALHPTLPKVRLTSTTPSLGIGQAFHTQLASFRQSMAERAAVALDEDFRSGLDDWNSRSGDATGWSYDATGFIKPGPLALYAPSTNLTDYQVQFLGMISKKSLSWVVRASDFDNYYVVKLVERKGGPLPEIGVTRYAVINGKAQNRVDTVVSISAHPEMMYLVKMDVKGNDFSMWVQDQMVDNWSEPRLPRGGVGFFSAKGEEGLLRWVQITHQYDMLGRLCAYLAPNNFSN